MGGLFFKKGKGNMTEQNAQANQLSRIFLLLSAVTAVAAFSGGYFLRDRQTKEQQEFTARHTMLLEAEKLAEAQELQYTGTLDETALNHALIKTYAEYLPDKYATYFSFADGDAGRINASLTRHSDGYQIAPAPNGNILVESVEDGSNAAKCGLQVDDVITAIDGQIVAEQVDLFQAGKLLLCEDGASIELTIQRAGEIMTLTYVRHKQTQSSVLLTWEGKTACVQIKEFAEYTLSDYNTVMDEIKTSQANGLLFDLRDNRGGGIETALAMLDCLLPEQKDYVHYEKADGDTGFLGKSDAEMLDLPVVVLVNEHTASSAELFAAVLRQYRQTPLVGTQTFGKGIFQSTHNLQAGIMQLTIGHFDVVGMDSWQGVGLTPDEIVEDENAQMQKGLALLR